MDVEAQPWGGVVDALEANDFVLAEQLVRSHVAALLRRMPKPRAAVLGCTHYPILKDVFQDALGPEVTVYSQGTIVAESLGDYLVRHPDMVGADGPCRYLTTGDPEAVSRAASHFVGKPVEFETA